jgi:hypothetical protein
MTLSHIHAQGVTQHSEKVSSLLTSQILLPTLQTIRYNPVSLVSFFS